MATSDQTGIGEQLLQCGQVGNTHDLVTDTGGAQFQRRQLDIGRRQVAADLQRARDTLHQQE